MLAEATPGSSRTRRNTSRSNLSPRTGSYPAMLRSNAITKRSARWKPTSIRRALPRLRRNKPPQIRRAAANVICVTTSRERKSTRRPPNGAVGVSFFSSETTFVRVARSAGVSPKMSAVAADAATANHTTFESTASAKPSRKGLGGTMPALKVCATRASASRAGQASVARMTLSVSICRINRPRVAPSANRVAISFRRPDARATSRFATFEQATSSTISAAPSPSLEANTIVSRGTHEGLSNCVPAGIATAP